MKCIISTALLGSTLDFGENDGVLENGLMIHIVIDIDPDETHNTHTYTRTHTKQRHFYNLIFPLLKSNNTED